MTEFPPQIINIHYSNVMEWFLLLDVVTPKPSTGASAQDVVDIDIQFARLHFTENKVASVPDDIASLVRGEITYLDATVIYSFLERTEGRGSARNIFGMFHSEAIKSWWTLLRSWEVGNTHIHHAVKTLVARFGTEEPNIERKYQAAEKVFRTIDNRLIELQRASLSYDRAYSDERKLWKKLVKEKGYHSSDRDENDSDDINNIYGEIINDLSASPFTNSMDYIFGFSKFAQSGSRTVHNDYQSVYKCLRALNVIPSCSEKGLSSSSLDSDELSGREALECFVRDQSFAQELSLELTGLKAFLNQKLITMQAEEDATIDPEFSSTNTVAVVDIFTHLKVVDALTQKLKNLRKILHSQLSSSTSSLNSTSDEVQLLRERAVKYRTIFEELKQNRQDVAVTLQRYSSDSKKLRESCLKLKQWLDCELSKLTKAKVTIRYG